MRLLSSHSWRLNRKLTLKGKRYQFMLSSELSFFRVKTLVPIKTVVDRNSITRMFLNEGPYWSPSRR